MSAKSKLRLDQLLVQRGLAETRTKAQAMIMAGEVLIADQTSTKPGLLVDTAVDLSLAAKSRYVSRGGDKLASAAEELDLDFTNKSVLDVGASTGGFTDYALQNGAAHVIAVDVGTGQLAWSLRNDPRVEVHEQTDIRQFESDSLVDVALADVSFVSSLKVVEAIARFVKPAGQIVLMIKPQFEVGKAIADKYHGVINDETVRQETLDKVRAELSQSFKVVAEADSKVLGPKGNQEHFILLRR